MTCCLNRCDGMDWSIISRVANELREEGAGDPQEGNLASFVENQVKCKWHLHPSQCNSSRLEGRRGNNEQDSVMQALST